MKRDQATSVIVDLLERLGAGGTWQLDVVQAVHVFGAYAGGAPKPDVVDLAVDIDRGHRRWRTHFIDSILKGRDPYAALRITLRGRRRAISIVFERMDHIQTLPIWQRGEAVEAAIARVRAGRADLPTLGPAAADASPTAFEDAEGLVPLYFRQELVPLVGAGIVTVGYAVLPDEDVKCGWARTVLDDRWSCGSPLRRAAGAVLRHWEMRDVDLALAHVHSRNLDLDAPCTPYFAGLGMTSFDAARQAFTEHGGVEWIEVLWPRRHGPLSALVLRRGPEFGIEGLPRPVAGAFR